MPKQTNPIPLKSFNAAGLADSKWSGVKNSFWKLFGLDLHSKPGIVRVAQKLTKDSGAVVDEFCKARVSSTNGSQYWGSSESGKVWERTSGGTWRLVHTVTPVAGEAKILGMAEYQDYIYIATESRLHRILSSEADDNDWSTDLVEDWATFTNTDDEFHPMMEQNRILYIGDAHFVAQVEANTFSPDSLDVKSPRRVKSLGLFSTDLLIGTYISDNVTKTVIYRWNTWSQNFTNLDAINEVGINSFLAGDNVTFVQAGVSGNVYVYNGEVLELYRKIPGDYSPTATCQTHPTSSASIGERMFFGISNITGNPCDQGVYQMGRNSRNYNYIIDLPYPISERSGGTFVTSGIEIGGILAVGEDLYVAWDNGNTKGIDKLDYSNKLNGAYIESRVIIGTREEIVNFAQAFVAYNLLPTNTAISLEADLNYAGYVARDEVLDTDRLIVETEASLGSATTLQFKIIFTTTSNDAPEIESAGIFTE